MKSKQKKGVDDIIRIHTDGSIFKNPGGVGGFAAVLTHGKMYKEMAGQVINTTNNRMEMMAVIKALELLKTKSKEVHVYSDSQYVIRGMNEWMKGWISRNWRGSTGGEVKNVDLWKQLQKLNAKHKITWIWIKGHAGHELNERADVLAKSAALGDYAKIKN